MSKALPEGPLAFVHGDDDFAVAQRARQIYHGWCEAEGGEDNEIIEAHSANAGEAVRALGRLHEAIDTLPFFGGGKDFGGEGGNGVLIRAGHPVDQVIGFIGAGGREQAFAQSAPGAVAVKVKHHRFQGAQADFKPTSFIA